MVLTAAMMPLMFMMTVTAAAMIFMLMFVVTVAAAAMMFFVVVMSAATMFLFQFFQICSNRSFSFHSMQQLLTGKLIPGRSNDYSIGITLAQQLHSLIQFIMGNDVRAGKNNDICGFHLVIVELTKVLHINLNLTGIHNSNAEAQLHTFNLIYSGDYIGQFANTGGLNKHTVRMIILNHLCQSLTKISHKRAANASGVHLGNIDTRILQKTAVNADLTEFVLNENQFLPTVAFLNHLFN